MTPIKGGSRQRGTMDAIASSAGVALMTDSLHLTPDRLRRVCNPKHFDFATTDELPELEEIVGQDRALEAIRLGVGIGHGGYNLFVLGPAGASQDGRRRDAARRNAVRCLSHEGACSTRTRRWGRQLFSRIFRPMKIIDTDGARVGQVNRLRVTQLGGATAQVACRRRWLCARRRPTRQRRG